MFEIFIFCVISFILLSLVYASISLAPWAPTRKKDMERFTHIFTPKIGDSFAEIGCGDARVALYIAQKYPNIEVYGYELAFPLFCIAFLRKVCSRKKNLHIFYRNIFSLDFGNYEHIYMYGMPDKISQKILPKFEHEAQKGAKLYSYVFSFPESYKKSVESFGGDRETKFHIYTK